MNKSKRITLTILALIGLALSIELCVVYINANFNPYALSSFCSVNELIDCDGAAKTVHSQCFGVPLCFWGIFLYFLFLFFTYVDKISNLKFLGFLKVFKRPESYLTALGLIAFILSMVLAGISLFEINKICILCFCTYFINLVVALVAKPDDENFFDVFKTSIADFIEAIKVKRYAISFFALVLLAAGFLTYTSVTNVFTPQVKQYKQLNKATKDAYNVSGNVLGDPNAELVVDIYTDYHCQFCFVMNTMFYRAVSELENLKIVHHHLPLDNSCNKYMPGPMHDGSCLMAKYAIAAGRQGKFWDLNTILFDKEADIKTEEDILTAARKLNLDMDKLQQDAHSKDVESELLKDIDRANELGIDGTPAMRINMETQVGIVNYDELKAKLLKAGAKERK